MTVQCLLWDFGDTLCDERSLWRVSPEWMEVYRSFDDGLGAAWCLGDLDTQGFVTELAGRFSFTEAEILAHLTRTDLFEFFPFTYAFFRAHHLSQAIVTVNPAMFSETIVPGFAFREITEAIVVSGEEGTIDKGELCLLALDRMNLEDPSRALLIDNKQANLNAWAERGGMGYLYTTDDAFRADVAGGIDGLISPGRRPGGRGPTYYELVIEAEDPETEIWLADLGGHLVQKEVGTLSTSLLAGNYTVEFGLGAPRHEIAVRGDCRHRQSELTAGTTDRPGSTR